MDSLEQHNRRLEEAEGKKRAAEERLREAQERERLARDELAKAEAALRDAGERYAGDVATWTEQVVELAMEAEAAAFLRSRPIDEMRGLAEAHAENVRQTLAVRRGQLDAAIRDREEDLVRARDERRRIAEEKHPPPPSPAWRPPRAGDRPGAPLYQLCDFVIGDSAVQARLEAALEASGLLDAWVAPDGVLLERRTFDVWVSPRPGNGGRTLNDVLAPTETAGVSRAAIEAALGSIELLEPLEEPAGEFWVATDGAWRMGPLQGAWSKDAAAYIGATAQERERARRLQELDETIERLERKRADLEAELASITARASAAAVELGQFPILKNVQEARARVEAILSTHSGHSVSALRRRRPCRSP